MLAHTNKWGRIKKAYANTRLIAHFTRSLEPALVILQAWNRVWPYMTPNVITETGSLNYTKVKLTLALLLNNLLIYDVWYILVSLLVTFIIHHVTSVCNIHHDLQYMSTCKACSIYIWFKSRLDRRAMYPKFDLTRVRTHDIWIMNTTCPWDACASVSFVLLMLVFDFFTKTYHRRWRKCYKIIFWFKYDFDRSATHPKLNLTGVRTYDLQIMHSTFYVPATLALINHWSWAIFDLTNTGVLLVHDILSADYFTFLLMGE